VLITQDLPSVAATVFRLLETTVKCDPLLVFCDGSQAMRYPFPVFAHHWDSAATLVLARTCAVVAVDGCWRRCGG
jgi:hypothetical protein